MTRDEAIARLQACTHPVSERFDVRAHPTIWALRWCRACGGVQVLEHGVPDPKWRDPVLLAIARSQPAAAAPAAADDEPKEPA